LAPDNPVEKLKITTFGGLTLNVGENILDQLVSRKTEALLVFLAVTRKNYPRETLADMLWSDRPQERAMSNLRTVLASLRKCLGDYVVITRHTAGIQADANIWIDATELESTVQEIQSKGGVFWPSEARLLGTVLDLYKGDFLQGFNLRGCREFENWMLVDRERLHQLVMAGLENLVEYLIESGDYLSGIVYAQQWVRLNPLMEAAHFQLMRLQYFAGRKADSLAQFKRYSQVLVEELGLEPSEEMLKLVSLIKREELKIPESKRIREPTFLNQPPNFLEEKMPDRVAFPVFAARKLQLERLGSFLDSAKGGMGKVVFVTGGPGRGKTALLNKFTQNVIKNQPDLLVAMGRCNAYVGMGDSYLPFREIISMFTGGVDQMWDAGVITRDHACRLWSLVPLTARIILDYGPDLIDTFVPAEELIARTEMAIPTQDSERIDAHHLAQIRKLVFNQAASQAGIEQLYLFEQLTNVLRELSRAKPLFLIIDDLQWADNSSIALLFHLARRLKGTRILIAGAYRQDEISLGRGGDRHPLAKVLSEIKIQYGDICIDLSEVGEDEDARFINELLDSEPNRLDDSFRIALLQKTNGHPLYTIELLRTMQERGDLILDNEGFWVERRKTNWDRLPARVEAVIDERITRLEPELRRVLTAASVEGEQFSVQVVANVQNLTVRDVTSMLTTELVNRHRLVKEQAGLSIDHNILYRFRFTHNLIQQYLYNQIAEGERRRIHAKIALALEQCLAPDSEDIPISVVLQLGFHFTQAREYAKAFEYLIKGGQRAFTSHAYQEAELCFIRAINLQGQQVSEKPASLYYQLGETYSRLADFKKAEHYLNQALDRSQEIGDIELEFETLLLLFYSSRLQGEYNQAVEFAHQSLTLAEKCGNLEWNMKAFKMIGMIYDECGDIGRGDIYFNKSLVIAKEIDDVGYISDNINNLGTNAHYRGDFKAAEDLFKQAYELASIEGDKWRLVYYSANLGKTVWRLGRYHEGFNIFNEAITICHQMRDIEGLSVILDNFGLALLSFGKYEEAIQKLNEGIAIARDRNLRCILARLLTNLGFALLQLGEYADAEEHFKSAHDMFIQINRMDNFDRCLLGLSLIDSIYGLYDEAFQKLGDCLKMSVDRKSTYLEADVMFYCGKISLEKGSYRRAYQFLKDGLNLFKGCEFPGAVSNCYIYLGHNAISMGELDSAKDYYRQALEISEKIELLPATAEALVGISRLLSKTDELNNAVRLAAFVSGQKECSFETREKAQKLLEGYAGKLDHEIYSTSLKTGKSMRIDEILLEINPYISV